MPDLERSKYKIVEVDEHYYGSGIRRLAEFKVMKRYCNTRLYLPLASFATRQEAEDLLARLASRG